MLFELLKQSVPQSTDDLNSVFKNKHLAEVTALDEMSSNRKKMLSFFYKFGENEDIAAYYKVLG